MGKEIERIKNFLKIMYWFWKSKINIESIGKIIIFNYEIVIFFFYFKVKRFFVFWYF